MGSIKDKIFNIISFMIVILVVLILLVLVDDETLQTAIVIASVIINPSKIKDYFIK